MITLTDLSKRFDKQFVVEDVKLKITPGEIVGLLGPNGAGKTTTLRMLAGVLPPTRGFVTIDGVNVHQDGEFVKKRIGFLPENNPLYEELTVEEFLIFWADIKGLRESEKKPAIDFIVENCGIAQVYYRPIAELSKGFRQRVGLAQAILTKPDILILDEPTEGLDPNQRQDISLLIKNLGKKRTVIISSHVLTEIAKLASRLVVIHKGKIVADETPEKFKRMGSKSNTLEVEIKGERVITGIKELEHVIGVTQIRTNTFEIKIKESRDIREDVFKLAVKKRWIILSLMQRERPIEDVFAQLTSE